MPIPTRKGKRMIHVLYFPNNPFTDHLSATHMMMFSDNGSDIITVKLMKWKGPTWVDTPLGSLKTADPEGWKALNAICPGAQYSVNPCTLYRIRARRLWCSLQAVGWKWKEGTGRG